MAFRAFTCPLIHMTKLTDNFSLKEFEHSNTAVRHGIDNKIPRHLLPNIQVVADELQKLREKVDKSIVINSGYRSVSLNKAIGGSATSQHAKCQAADFESPGYSNILLAMDLVDHEGICFDQLIIEDISLEDKNKGWVHCSFIADKERSRGQILKMERLSGGKPAYFDIGVEGLRNLANQVNDGE